MTTDDLKDNEYDDYYKPYLLKASGFNLKSGLELNAKEISYFFENLSEDKANYRYAEGKWTVKEVFQHIIDTERVFSYRALRVSRNDKTALPGFDHDLYVENCNVEERTLKDLIREYQALRQSTICLFNSFTEKLLLRSGIASDSNISVRAIGFILMGHELHHCQILRERYL